MIIIIVTGRRNLLPPGTKSFYHTVFLRAVRFLRLPSDGDFRFRVRDGERMCESRARFWRAVDPGTRNLPRSQDDLWLRFPWTFVIRSVSKSSWQLLSATLRQVVLSFIVPVSAIGEFQISPSCIRYFRPFKFFAQFRGHLSFYPFYLTSSRNQRRTRIIREIARPLSSLSFHRDISDSTWCICKYQHCIVQRERLYRFQGISRGKHKLMETPTDD